MRSSPVDDTGDLPHASLGVSEESRPLVGIVYMRCHRHDMGSAVAMQDPHQGRRCRCGCHDTVPFCEQAPSELESGVGMSVSDYDGAAVILGGCCQAKWADNVPRHASSEGVVDEPVT